MCTSTACRIYAVTLLLALFAMVAQAAALRVIVTFPSLKPDVSQLLCPGDTVEALVPSSVDPHEYQLKPSDVEKLKQADLIVSTGHAPFEKRIEELATQGVIHAPIFVVWRVPGIRIVDNPVTGQPDLHMPIYDPRNYILFIRALADELSRLNPSCAKIYMEKAEAIVSRVERLIEEAPRLNATGVADMPFTIYAVEWLGIRVEALLVPQPGMPTSPKLYEEASRLLASGAVAIVTSPPRAKPSESLLTMAREYGAPYILVPSPLNYTASIPEKLEYIVEQVERLARAGRVAARAAYTLPDWVRWVMVVAGASLAFGALSILVAARRLYFMAASLPHSSLLAATLAIPLAFTVGGVVPLWATITAVALSLAFYALIEKGVDTDVASSVFVSAAASGSVAAMYYVLSRYSLTTSLWAYILGDPLLVSMSDAILTVAVGVAALIYTVLTYRENVCIGLDVEGARLAGLRVRLYDALTITVLAAASVLLLRSVGFVVEHVLLLLPGAVASTAARSAWRALAYSIIAAEAAGLLGLALALILGAAPAATIGGVMLAFYVAALAWRGRL